METNHIHEFVILAETCSFQETAAQTFISQSSLTKHIQSLEKELGIPLFDRTTRTVKLNQYGREFYQYARQIDRACQESRNAIHTLLRKRSGKITVAFQSRLGQYGIIQLFSVFQKEYPQYPLKMIESSQVVRLLETDECDFVFTFEKRPPGDKTAEFVCRTDNMVAAVPANHPLAKESNITLKQLQNEKIIIHEDTSQNMSWETRTLRQLCAEADISLNEVMTVSFSSNLIRMVEKNLGIGMINRLHITDDADGDVVFVNISPKIAIQTKLMYHKQIANWPAAAAFIQFVKKESQKLFPA